MKYILIKANGTVKEVYPKNKKMSLEELQEFVEGYVEHVSLKHGNSLWVNEEGKIDQLPFNPIAQLLWDESHGQTDTIVGDVLFVEVRPVKGFEKLLEFDISKM